VGQRYGGILIAALGCSAPHAMPDAAADAASVVRIALPAYEVAAAEERYACSYHVLGDDIPAIARITFYGNAPIHGFTVDVDPAAAARDGTSDDTCLVSDEAVTLLSARRQQAELALPATAPLRLSPGSGLVVRLHILNPDDAPAVTEAWLDVHPAAAATTTSGLVGATRFDFSAPPGTTRVETRCRVPAGARLAALYPTTRRSTYEVTVTDGAALLAMSYDWEHPPRTTWETLYSPADELVSRCLIVNTTGQTLVGGPALADERCGLSLLVVPGADVASCRVSPSPLPDARL
jgi:hypothetical protein